MHRCLGTRNRKIRVQIGLELIQQHFQFGFVEFPDGRDLHGIHDHRTFALHHLEKRSHQRRDRVVEIEKFPDHSDARPSQAAAIEKVHVVRLRFPSRTLRRRIRWIDPRHGGQQNRRIRHRAANRSCRILAVRDGNNSRPAHQSQRRLDAHHSIRRRRTYDRAVRLRAHRDGAKIRSHRRARPGTRSARIAIERIRAARLPAAPAPSARRMVRAKIRPLAQVRLAQNHGSGFAQPLRHARILLRRKAEKRERTSRRHHAIRRADVVLDQHRNTMHRPPRPLCFALRIHRIRNCQRIRIQLDHRIQRRPPLINRLDSLEIFLHNRPRRKFPRLHPILQFSHGYFVQLKRLLLLHAGGSKLRSQQSRNRQRRRPQRHPSHAVLQKFPPAQLTQFAYSINSAHWNAPLFFPIYVFLPSCVVIPDSALGSHCGCNSVTPASRRLFAPRSLSATP